MGPILGALFAALIFITWLPRWANFQTTANEDQRIAITAKQETEFNNAVSQYVQSNSVAIQAAATPAVTFNITTATLQGANFLSASFNATNPYGQTWQAQVLEPVAGNLQTLVFATGGTQLTDRVVTKIANLVGNQGGFLPLNDSGLYPGAAANAYGAFGTWGPLDTANYVGIVAGRPAALLTFNNGQLTDNRLYRNSIPGQPQLNTMNTPIIMGAGTQQVVNTACVTLGAIGRDALGKVLTCDGATWKMQGSLYWEDPVATKALLDAIPCNAASINVTRVVETPTTGTGRRAYTCNGAGTWNALAVDDFGNLTVANDLTVNNNATITNNLTVNGNTTLGNAAADTVTIPGNASIDQLSGDLEITTVAVEGAACAPNGRLARDANGLILSCQSGVWQKAGGSGSSGTMNGSNFSRIASASCTCFGWACTCNANATCTAPTPNVVGGYCSGGGGGASGLVLGNTYRCSGTAFGTFVASTAFCN